MLFFVEKKIVFLNLEKIENYFIKKYYKQLKIKELWHSI